MNYVPRLWEIRTFPGSSPVVMHKQIWSTSVTISILIYARSFKNYDCCMSDMIALLLLNLFNLYSIVELKAGQFQAKRLRLTIFVLGAAFL